MLIGQQTFRKRTKKKKGKKEKVAIPVLACIRFKVSLASCGKGFHFSIQMGELENRFG